MKTNIKQVRFSEEELEKIEKAVNKYNDADPFGKITASDIIRKGTKEFVKKIMLAKKVRMVFEE